MKNQEDKPSEKGQFQVDRSCRTEGVVILRSSEATGDWR